MAAASLENIGHAKKACPNPECDAVMHNKQKICPGCGLQIYGNVGTSSSQNSAATVFSDVRKAQKVMEKIADKVMTIHLTVL